MGIICFKYDKEELSIKYEESKKMRSSSIAIWNSISHSRAELKGLFEKEVITQHKCSCSRFHCPSSCIHALLSSQSASSSHSPEKKLKP